MGTLGGRTAERQGYSYVTVRKGRLMEKHGASGQKRPVHRTSYRSPEVTLSCHPLLPGVFVLFYVAVK